MRAGTNKKGYMTLEAAVFLPVFIIGILTLGYFIKIFSTSENVTHAMLDETGHLAAQAYGIKTAPFFPAALQQRLKEENSHTKSMQVRDFYYLYRDGKHDGVISAECRYEMDLSLPLDFSKGIQRESRIKCRGFIGNDNSGIPMAFEEMERNGDADFVWIFPMWGQKFHGDTCIYVKNQAKQMVLTPALKKRYRACQLCDSETSYIGSYVYCFTDTGQVYHKESCKQVDKYVIEIEKEDALAKGYSPCSKCGGGM